MAKRNEKARAAGVGIDVSKKDLVVCVRREGGAEERLQVGNDGAGVRKLLKALAGCACPIVIEATSHYSWLAAVSLSEAGLDPRVINPILTAKYSKSKVRLVKSDPADAALLAGMAESEPCLPPRFCATREGLVWRKEYGLLETLKRKCSEMRVAVAGAREAASSLGLDAAADLAPAESALKALDAAARKAEAALAARAASLSGGLAARLATIPGVSPSAAGLASQLMSASGGRDARSWVAFVGLDVSVRQSGSWRGRTRLTKRGSAVLRHRLFCCAWGAVRNDDRFRAYFDELAAKGHKYTEALVIIARRIVRMMFTIASGQAEAYVEAMAFPAKKRAVA